MGVLVIVHISGYVSFLQKYLFERLAMVWHYSMYGLRICLVDLSWGGWLCMEWSTFTNCSFYLGNGLVVLCVTVV